MRKTVKILTPLLLAVIVIFAGLIAVTEEGTSLKTKALLAFGSLTADYEFVKESEYPIASGIPEFEVFTSLEALFERSVLVAEVTIQDSMTEYHMVDPPSIETWLDAEVKQVFKGDTSLKSVQIAERGGVIDMSKSKGNESRSSGTVREVPPFVEDATDGVPVMKKGNTYIAFLIKGAKENSYVVTGTIQGKIRISDTTNRAVITIDPDQFADQMYSTYWMQRKFAGMERSEIYEVLHNLEK